MGPKINDVEVKFNVEDSFVLAALPYRKASYQRAEEAQENEESPQVRSDEPAIIEHTDVGGPLRVSTRARFSYELDRYNKNALLIFEGNTTDVNLSTEDDADESDDMSTKFKRTFEQYRFEVEVHSNLNDDEIASTCDRFFQQDFTDYGCVAVMMLAKTRRGIVETSHSPRSEFGVMRYMSDLLPPTLRDKPTIYIVQTEGYYLVPRARIWSTLPQDNLEFRLLVPNVSSPDARGQRSSGACLLKHIHEKLTSLGDQTDFCTLLQDAVNEFVYQTPTLHGQPFRLYSSLTKELRLVRTPEP
nr:uncharacterized protein LOC110380182 [Helicoverpa armigera]